MCVRSAVTAACVAASAGGRTTARRSSMFRQRSGGGSAIAALTAFSTTSAVAERNSRQSAVRSRRPSIRHSMRRSSTSGRLLAAHVGRLAGLDVEGRPALDVAIEHRAGPVERGRGVGLAGGEERGVHVVLLRGQGDLVAGLVAVRQRPDPVQAGGRAAREAGPGRARPPVELREQLVHRREAVQVIRRQPALDRGPQPGGNRVGLGRLDEAAADDVFGQLGERPAAERTRVVERFVQRHAEAELIRTRVRVIDRGTVRGTCRRASPSASPSGSACRGRSACRAPSCARRR